MTSSYDKGLPNSATGGSLDTLSAFFDDRSEAESAIKRLKDIGLADDRIRFLPGYEAEGDLRRTEPGGWWAGLADWFFPAEDRALYAEGLNRGGYLVSVQVDEASYERAHDILDDEGSIDMDERADQWRGEGWDDTLARSTGTDPETTDLAVDAARNSRDLEKSTPRVRSYRYEDRTNETNKPA
ncbi:MULTISPECIES: hypothetical protein [unclassified Rhizobium]|uniref:hypothetical protein n=1 Tax=unclassified Rhizobium TaxID=2613769 RepID=UPI000B53043D|nr:MULTISPECIES: hypothetical protein [unclassified Rhizobium]